MPRTLSPNAATPAPKTGRTSVQVCVTAADKRPLEVASQTDAGASASQHGIHHKPYSKWNLQKYLQEGEDSRGLFWSKAPKVNKEEVAAAITANYREQDELFQEARWLGGEAWGLGRVSALVSASQDVSASAVGVVEREEEVVGEENL